MKLFFVLFVFCLYFINRSDGTKCYNCGDGSYDVCREVGSKTPTVDVKNDYGCVTVWKNVTNSTGAITPDLRIYERLSILNEERNKSFCEKDLNLDKTQVYKCCKTDLCNSAEGVCGRTLVIFITATYLVYNML